MQTNIAVPANTGSLPAEAARLISLWDHPAALIDINGIILSHNSAMSELLGQQNKGLNGLDMAMFLLSDVARQFPTLLHCAAKSETRAIPSHQNELRLNDGIGALSLKPYPISDDTTWFLCQLAYQTDQSDPRLRVFMEHSEQGVWDFDIDAQRFVVSRNWRTIRGLSPDDPLEAPSGRHWLEDVHKDDRERLAAVFLDTESGAKGEINTQYRVRHKDGHWVWIMCRGRVLECDSHGRPMRMVGTDTDITDLKNAQAELANLAGQMHLAIDVAGIGIWNFDPVTETTYWDDTILDMYGVSDGRNNRPSSDWFDYIHPDDLKTTIAVATERAEQNALTRYDFRVLRPDGTIRHIRSISRKLDPADPKSKVIGINLDVTEDYQRTEELETTRQLLEYESRHDPLTGLANRRMLDETVNDLFTQREGQGRIAVLHLDLDHFKQINDSLGHAAGDAVLQHVAGRMRQVIPDPRLIARAGGDEFVVILDNAPGIDALTAIATNIIGSLRDPFEYHGHMCAIGTSIGIAVTGSHDLGPVDIFKRADLALYEAKDQGRGRLAVYSDQIRHRSVRRIEDHQGLLDALSNGAVSCRYQPQFDAHDLSLIGAEALVHWDCPIRGQLYPDDFLPMADEEGIIAKIDASVRRIVLNDQAEWAAMGLPVPPVSLNISRERLADRTLGQELKDLIKPFHRLRFELLETVDLDAPTSNIRDNLDLIRALGIGIDLDDFGSGHASIVALQAVRPQRIKIDQKLVLPILTKPTQLPILRALIRIARLERASVVIEGVETLAHLSMLRKLDCDVFQGHALARPVSQSAFAALLGRTDTHLIAAT